MPHAGALYDGQARRRAIRRALWRAAQRRAAGNGPLDLPGRLHLSVVGGAQLIVIARKARAVAPFPRPPMNPDRL